MFMLPYDIGWLAGVEINAVNGLFLGASPLNEAGIGLMLFTDIMPINHSFRRI
jgi:hypothetical protein